MDSQSKSFNDLPGELVCHVMTHLSSMGDKLRLGSVSHRFHRCANEHLRNCVWPLELHTVHFSPSMFDSWHLFDVDLPAYLTRILVTMARKTCFSPIILHVHNSKEMASVQHACQSLTHYPECLSKTEEFKIDYDGKTVRSLLGLERFQSNNPIPNLPDITYEVLGHCSELIILHICHVTPDCPKLQASLSGRGLTEIVLDGVEVQCEALTDFFCSLKPNTLKTVRLNVNMEKPQNWTIAQFFEQMCLGPWLNVEDLLYNFKKITVPVADFKLVGDLLYIFPSLRNCTPHCNFSFQPTVEDYIECINRFLESAEKSHSPVERSVTFGQLVRAHWPACNLVTLMERIIDRYPERSCKLTFQGRRVDSVAVGYTLSLCTDITTFIVTNMGVGPCRGNLAQGPFIVGDGGFVAPMPIDINAPAADNIPPPLANPHQAPPCAICRRFYGNVFKQIMRNVGHQQGGHIPDYFMNPCQAERLLAEMRAARPNEQVQVNRNSETGRYAINVGDLQVTVDAQACIVPGCSECLENLVY